MIQKITLFLMVLCLAFCLLAVTAAHANPGLVSVDSVDAGPGDKVAVPVRLSDFTEPLFGYTVYLTFDDTRLQFDSGSFVGSIAYDDMPRYIAYVPDSNKIWFRIIPMFDEQFDFVGITEPNGVLATLYFHLSPLVSAGYNEIDSLNYQRCFPFGCEIERINLAGGIRSSDPNLEIIYPNFKAGGVSVQIATDVEDNVGAQLPEEFVLDQNYPNPFNPSTVIGFSLPKADRVRLTVYNVLGQQIETLVDRPMAAGRHEVEWSAERFPSGIYFYKLIHSGGAETRKMVLTK